jgi:multicomponent K+:H+ antiporter subunit D
MFLAGAVAITGMPPLGGFVGKALILSALQPAAGAAGGVYWIWAAVLLSSLLALLGLSRAGITLLWCGPPSDRRRAGAPASEGASLAAGAALLAMSPLLVLLAGPVSGYTRAAAAQALSGADYARAIEAMTSGARTLPAVPERIH